MSGATMSVSLESLLWNQEDGKLAEKLVYYDLEGRRYDKEAGGGLIDEALKLFGGSVKAVKRSTGGLVIAEPYQLIVYGDPTKEGGRTDIRIRVRFRDFKRGANNRVVSPEYVIHTKTVLPEDLKEPFSYRCAGRAQQRFVMDFGQGIVPVHVVHYEIDPSGDTIAYFLDHGDMEQLRTAAKGTKTSVQVYRCDRDVLRFAPDDPERGPIEYGLAAANHRRLRLDNQQIVPDVLKSGGPTPLLAGLPAEEIQKALSRVLEHRGREKSEPLCFTLDEDDDLKPFGIFEG